MKMTTTESTIQALRCVFGRHGLPEVTQFASADIPQDIRCEANENDTVPPRLQMARQSALSRH